MIQVSDFAIGRFHFNCRPIIRVFISLLIINVKHLSVHALGCVINEENMARNSSLFTVVTCAILISFTLCELQIAIV